MIERLSSHDNVRLIEANNEFKVELEGPEQIFNEKPNAPMANEWNVDWVKAPAVWERGFKGKGMVVANADTGVQWEHPAFTNTYRGRTSFGVNHNFNWYDAVRTGGSRCGGASPVPCDDNGHGTHTLGTAVGETPATTYGVAPEASWIGCRNMNAGAGTPALYITCMEFFTAPFQLDRTNANPSLRAHVIGNSWGCPTSEGCSTDSLRTAVENVVQAGIFFSVSAGNSGSACSTVTDPPSFYAASFSVGATGLRSNTIATYSSRGPATRDGSGRLKPEIVAPGSSVTSSYPDNRYSSLSGTSMASPHITGAIALLWSGIPGLARNIPRTIQILTQSATQLSSTLCGGGYPNNVYGYGQLDLSKALEYALSLNITSI
jgi:subtilisin family serine protease